MKALRVFGTLVVYFAIWLVMLAVSWALVLGVVSAILSVVK